LTLPKQITEYKNAFRSRHGCESLHVASVPVEECKGGRTISDDVVEIFELVGLLDAGRGYAWTYVQGDKRKVVTMLQTAQVHTPQQAVLTAAAQDGLSNE